MQNLIYFILLLIPMVWTPSLHAMRPQSEDTSTFNECLWNQEVLNGKLSVDCNDLYHHYLPQKTPIIKSNNTRIGSYNIFRSSDQRTYKRLDLNAELIDSEWDVVSVVELQPNRAMDMGFNVNARVALEKKIIDNHQFNLAYNLPPYIELLLELQKKDPSWGLLISPYSQGTDTELFGFLYRGSHLQPASSKYCQKQLDYLKNDEAFIFREIAAKSFGDNGVQYKKDGRPVNPRRFISPQAPLACYLNLSGESKALFSKIPFVARFSNSNMDFSFMTLHSRFRAADEFQSDCVETCQNTAEKMLNLILEASPGANINQQIRDQLFKDQTLSKGESREINRYYEAFIATQAAIEIKDIEKDNDVLIGGDFNLELVTGTHWRALLWDKIVALRDGLTIAIKEKTSLSDQKGYGNNYDHFIYNPSLEDFVNCPPSSAHVVDFVSEQLVLTSDFPLSQILASLTNPQFQNEALNYAQTRLERTFWVTRTGEILDYQTLQSTNLESLPKELKASGVNCPEPNQKTDRFEMTVADKILADLRCNALYTNEPYRHLSFAMSDHIPISLRCEF